MRVAVAHLTEVGCTEIRLWVLADNPRARRFYERYGLTVDGAEKRFTVDAGGRYETRARGSALHAARTLIRMALGYVRPARADEAAEIARIQLVDVAYGVSHASATRSILDGLDQAWMAEQWREAITAPPTSRHRVLIAIEQAGRDENRARDADPARNRPSGRTSSGSSPPARPMTTRPRAGGEAAR